MLPDNERKLGITRTEIGSSALIDRIQPGLPVQRDERKFRDLVKDYRDGVNIFPSPLSFISYGDLPSRRVLVQRTLRAVIVSTHVDLKDGKLNLASAKNRSARCINMALAALGHSIGQEVVCKEIEGLSEEERKYLYRVCLSTNFKMQIGFPDAAECTERQMADYIKLEGYRNWGLGSRRGGSLPHLPAEQAANLHLFCCQINERDGCGFSASKVVDIVCES
ncbi:MAG: hypothetical protein Q7S03_04360 [bacterium]|nr:hypothetical protein [bacterium]